MAVPRWAVYGVLVLLDHLTLRATQRAEYLADQAAARAGSTEAAVELLDRLLITDSVRLDLRRRRLVEAPVPHPAAVRPAVDCTAAVDAELAGARSRVARKVIRDYAG